MPALPFFSRSDAPPDLQTLGGTMDLFLLVLFYLGALTVQYPGPMSVLFLLFVLKIAVSWLRSRRLL
jgi:hypothetical protein